MDDFEKELKQDFLEESTDLLNEAEAAFLRLESDRSDPELINEIFRLAHNLKGTSNAVGFAHLSELTHVAENLILKIKENEMVADDEVVSVLLEFKDKVNEMVTCLKEDLDASFDTIAIQGKIKDIIEKGNSQSTEYVSDEIDRSEADIDKLGEFENLEVSSQETEDEIEDDVDSGEQLNAQEEIASEPLLEEASAADVEVPKSIADLSKAQKKPEEPKKAVKSAGSNSPEGSIRVKLSRIGKINNVVGELVILQTVISQRRFEYCKDEIMNKSIGSMNKLFKEVQEIAMSLRMVSIRPTFQKMSRIVRDVSRSLDKDVSLVLYGEDTEVDKTVLEKLGDPLVHIVRNAVDHGLESSAEREKNGKNPQGRVDLRAYHEGSNLIVQIKDDGKGIDPEKIKAIAIKKGVISASNSYSDEELINLIFHPGFSTKDKVTDVSGRGVGMDVVRTNIDNLGGEVRLTSEIGKGSTFTIALPLTLAIIEGLVIKAKDEKYVVPLSQISEIVQVDRAKIKPFSGVADLFEIRGEVMPIFSLNEKLYKKKNKEHPKSALVVRGLTHSFAVSLDDLVNQQQIVIKKLGEDIQGKKGIMGSAIMSTGRPALILDLYELYKDDIKKNGAYNRFKNDQWTSA